MRLLSVCLIGVILIVCGCGQSSSGKGAPPPDIGISLSAASIGQYEKLELNLALTFTDEYTNPFDPDEIDMRGVFTSPTAAEWTVPAFWDGLAWKIRFAADETGEWTCRVEADTMTENRVSTDQTFTVNPSGLNGWIRVSDDDLHFLEYDSGESFLGRGHCRPWWLDPEDESNTFNPVLVQVNNVNQINWNGMNLDSLCAAMNAAGMNWLVYWLAPWDNLLVTSDDQHGAGYIGSGCDRYDMNAAVNLDRLFETAEQYGIHIQLCLWPHDALRDTMHDWYVNWNSAEWWSLNPFNQINPDAAAFFTDSGSWAVQAKLYRYMIARWGYSQALGMWDVAVEIDGTMAGANAVTWVQGMTDYFHANDPFGHPVTGSRYDGGSSWDAGFAVMDVPQMHYYSNREDPVAAGDDIAAGIAYLRANFAKPAFYGEFGTDNQVYQPDHLHAGIWASLAAGSAICALDWNDGGNWGDMTPAMYDHMLILSAFTQDIAFDKLGLQEAALSAGGLTVLGMGNNTFAFGWIQDPVQSATITGAVLQYSGLSDGNYTVEWWDTWILDGGGAPQLTRTDTGVNSTGGTFTIGVPDFYRDTAFKIVIE
ncbi:DUF5060 domain-containing protein [Planctomycetota bacterium]